MTRLLALVARGRAAVRAHPALSVSLLALTLAQLVLRGLALSQSYFWQDDFLYTNLARTLPALEFLSLDYRGHLQPGQFAVVLVLARLAPLDWTVHAAFLLGLQLVADVLFAWLLVAMFGPRRAVLLPFAVALFCPLAVPPLLWFAAALQWLPLAIATLLLLLCHVHLVDATGRSRRRWQGVAVLAFVVSLAFWERALSLVGVLALVELTWLARDRGLRRWTAPLRRAPLVWTTYAAAVAAYIAIYSVVSAGTPSAAPSASDVLALLRETAGTLVPGLLGGPWGVENGAESLMRPPDHPLNWIAGQVAVAVVVGLLLAGPRRLTRAWTVPLTLLLVDTVVVAATRLDFIGALIGRDPRYFVDVVPLAAIALAVTFLPVLRVEPVVEVDGTRTAPRAWWARWRPAPRLVVLVGLVALYVNSSWVTTMAIAGSERDDPGRAWLETARQAARDLPPGVGVRDAPVPAAVVSEIFGGEAMLSSVLGSLPEWEDRIGTTTNDLRDVNPSGDLERVLVDPPVSSAEGPVPDCGYRVGGRPVDIRLDETAGEGWLVRIEYLSGLTVPARVDAGAETFEVQFADGVDAVYVFPSGPVDTVTISGVDVDAGLCVTEVAAAPPIEPDS